MEEINEDELIIYEESREIKETVWKIWDIINDKKILTKLLLNTSLVKDLKAAHSQSNEIFDAIENNNEIEEEKNPSSIPEEDEFSIILNELQYENHLKTIIYIIDSIYIQKDKDKEKEKNSSSKNMINSSSENSNSMKNETDTNSGEKKLDKNLKNYIKLIMMERPNTSDDTKLLTITMIDYSEMLTENQLKNIVQYMFNNFTDILSETMPINQNSESIIINANINIVFFFWANWRTPLAGKDIVRDIKFNGDPKIPGNTLEFIYLNKYKLKIIVDEINSFIQRGNEDDDNEWNYKYTIIGNKGQSECLNCIFLSCENGTKTFVTIENDINKNIGIDRLQELSKRKLFIITRMKEYIENNLEYLKKLGNDVFEKY